MRTLPPARSPALSLDEARTTATLVLLVVGLWVLNILARPITPFRGVLFGAMVGAVFVVLALPPLREFYAFELPPRRALVIGAIIAGSALRCWRSRGTSRSGANLARNGSPGWRCAPRRGRRPSTATRDA